MSVSFWFIDAFFFLLLLFLLLLLLLLLLRFSLLSSACAPAGSHPSPSADTQLSRAGPGAGLEPTTPTHARLAARALVVAGARVVWLCMKKKRREEQKRREEKGREEKGDMWGVVL